MNVGETEVAALVFERQTLVVHSQKVKNFLLLLRWPWCGRRGDGIGEVRNEPTLVDVRILRLRWIVLMIVAASTFQRQPHECSRKRMRSVGDILYAKLFQRDTPSCLWE